MMTLEQAAEFMHWHPATLRRKIKQDPTLPHSKKGKEYRFIKEHLERWVAADYSTEAKNVVEGICENVESTGKSPLTELENLRRQLRGRTQQNSKRN